MSFDIGIIIYLTLLFGIIAYCVWYAIQVLKEWL